MAIDFDPSAFNSDVDGQSLPRPGYLFSDENICGEGASCRVYVQRLGGLRVAIKRLRKELLDSPTHIAAYRKEFEIGQRLRHDALPVYLDFQPDGDEVCIMMDFVDGITLDSFIKTDAGREYFSRVTNVERFLTQLLDVIGYLHRSGVIHCDLKPANIMLRHTDRRVMLLDLDKAYCDTLDTTHGGSKGSSELLPPGSKPTTAKDFEAIGNLIDWFNAHVKGFPRRRFRRFCRECRRDTDYDRLFSELKPRNYGKRIIGAVLIVGLLSAAVYMMTRHQKASVEVETTDEDILEAVDTTDLASPETVGTIGRPAVATEAQQLPADTGMMKPDIGADFDEQMAGFIVKAESALEIVKSGTATDAELREIMYDVISADYHDRYMSLLDYYKSRNSGMNSLDVELAVVRHADESRASMLRSELSKAIADTLVGRHPERE